MHPEYSFASHFLNVDGHQLHYLDEGSGPVIVMVHGNPTWSFYYRKVINLFKNRYRIIVPDHLGCGLSDKPQHYNYCLAQHIDNLSQLLQHLKIDTCSLVVHDWGGAIGMGWAGRNPTAIEKIVLLNTAAFRSQSIPLRIAICRFPVLGELIVRGCNGFAWPATFMAVTRKLNTLTKKWYLQPYNSWKNRVAIHHFVKDIPLSSRHLSYNTLVEVETNLAKLNNLNIPMLVLWGGKDFCFTKEFYDEWLVRFPGAESHYFKELGHYILEDGFEELKPFLLSFFDAR